LCLTNREASPTGTVKRNTDSKSTLDAITTKD
jgi:hypothetical protein